MAQQQRQLKSTKAWRRTAAVKRRERRTGRCSWGLQACASGERTPVSDACEEQPAGNMVMDKVVFLLYMFRMCGPENRPSATQLMTSTELRCGRQRAEPTEIAMSRPRGLMRAVVAVRSASVRSSLATAYAWSTNVCVALLPESIAPPLSHCPGGRGLSLITAF
jgi:hypothetical protein